MASEDRYDPDFVKRLSGLAEQIQKYDFYAALRLLETMHADKPRFGESARPDEDSVRLEQEISMRFAPSTLHSLTDKKGHWRLKVLFYGLFGPNGALPLHLTEYALGRKRDARDTAMADFLDIFHHRLISLFYRSWANKEPTVQYDRPEQNRFHLYIGSLLGIGIPELQNRDRMPDDNKLHFAAHLGSQTSHVSGLVALLRSFFKMPLQVDEFVGEWLKIPEENLTRLGKLSEGQLGVDAVAGGYSWQCQFKFRIRLGPMPLRDYEKLLPGGEKLKLLGTVIRNYLGDELNWDVNLILLKDEVPPLCLGKYGQLGLTSWVVSETPGCDVDDLLVSRSILVHEGKVF